MFLILSNARRDTNCGGAKTRLLAPISYVIDNKLNFSRYFKKWGRHAET